MVFLVRTYLAQPPCLPEVLFNWDVSGIPKSFWGQLFEASANGICVLAVQNMVPELLRIGSILSACLFVCLSLFNFLQAHFLDRFWTEFIRNFRKRTLQKRELEPVSVGEADHFHATLPRSLHSPQVATAAPPSPLGPIGGVAVETCT